MTQALEHAHGVFDGRGDIRLNDGVPEIGAISDAELPIERAPHDVAIGQAGVGQARGVVRVVAGDDVEEERAVFHRLRERAVRDGRAVKPVVERSAGYAPE